VVAPADWKEVRLGDLLGYEQPTKYLVSSSDYVEGGRVPVLTAGKSFLLGYTDDTDGIYTNLPTIIFDDFTTATQWVDFEFKVKSSACKMLRPKNGSCNPRYVFERLRALKYQTSDHKRHWISVFHSMEMLMPPLREQEVIAEVLNDTDAAIESLDALIAKKRDVKQATMQQLLTGRIRLPGFTADWKEVRLGEICELSLAASKKSRSDGRGKYIIADMGSVSKDGSFLTHKTTDVRDDVLRTGDLVMPKDDIGGGQIIGKAVLVDEDERYVLGDHVYRLRLSDGFPAFVRYGINSYKVNIQLRSKVVGSAQLGLGRRAVLEQPISFPPLKEQEAIAEALTAMDDELEALTEQVSKLRMVKEGMMQDLLTGKVRLV
jgi:type I restriction enzyme S subunit